MPNYGPTNASLPLVESHSKYRFLSRKSLSAILNSGLPTGGEKMLFDAVLLLSLQMQRHPYPKKIRMEPSFVNSTFPHYASGTAQGATDTTPEAMVDTSDKFCEIRSDKKSLCDI